MQTRRSVRDPARPEFSGSSGPASSALVSALRRLPGWESASRSIDQAAGRARQRQLEAELLAAEAEIARLRKRLEEATRPPTQFAQMRMREAAIGRLTRLWLARGSDRQY